MSLRTSPIDERGANDGEPAAGVASGEVAQLCVHGADAHAHARVVFRDLEHLHDDALERRGERARGEREVVPGSTGAEEPLEAGDEVVVRCPAGGEA